MRAVIFDFDGVLVDSLRINFEAKKALFAPFGIRLSEREFVDIWVCPENSKKEGIQYLIKLKGLKASVEELRAMQKPIYEKLFKEKAKPMPGVLALIRRLRKRGV
ncbi:MAG: HAD family phosphatase, partial [Candidatus Diapherotrites archaeon]|nr:HAD family phosphatase [Candidatus Diapherotrites archaeon]